MIRGLSHRVEIVHVNELRQREVAWHGWRSALHVAMSALNGSSCIPEVLEVVCSSELAESHTVD